MYVVHYKCLCLRIFVPVILADYLLIMLQQNCNVRLKVVHKASMYVFQ